MAWTARDIPDQTGRHVVITGAASGLGRVSAEVLAARGADVTLAVRNLAAGETAAAQIRQEVPSARLRVEELDLGSLESVRNFAERIDSRRPEVDVLMNNAGVMRGPRRTTADGFELQFGTNFLGHFALTGRLLPRLRPGARIVTLSY